MEKVLRNRNHINQPVYLLIRRESDNKRVLSTIEFLSNTYREYEIPGIDSEKSTYIITNISDANLQWQEIVVVETKEDKDNNEMTQRLVHAKIRIGQYEIEKEKEIVILNRDTLQPDMDNV